MKRPFNLASAVVLSVALVCSTSAQASGVQVRFNVHNPQVTPLPSDLFSTEDPDQNTGLRVNLPFPDCSKQVSDCELIEQINLLDGFNLQPRLSIPFTGPIDVETVSSETVFLIHLGSTLSDSDDDIGKVIGINQVVWDPKANRLHVESDEFLHQHTRYVFIVTRGVRNSDGVPISAKAFERFRRKLESEPELRTYSQALDLALRAAREEGVPIKDVAAASVFTTQSITSFLEKARDQIKARRPEPAKFELGFDGSRTVFPLEDLVDITGRIQIGTDTFITFNRSSKELDAIGINSKVVSTIAFGSYQSPNYRTRKSATNLPSIPPIATRTGNPQAFGTNEVFFNLFLPAGEKPARGWPIAVYGHGTGNLGKNVDPNDLVATLAEYGIATIAINAVGYGGGKESTLTIKRPTGDNVIFSAGGRGVDLDNDGRILALEDFFLTGTGQRQTALDLMQLVRILQTGVDANGDGVPDLDSSRIYYAGGSLGGMYGLLFLAADPDVSVAVLNVPPIGGTTGFRLSPVNRAGLEVGLSRLEPPLTNVGDPGACEEDASGCDLRFNENLPLRNQPPVINDVPGALAIQAYIDNREWTGQFESPVAYAAHLRKKPLARLPANAVIIQFAKGDQYVPNPSTTAILRAGELADRATFYRHDLVFNDPSVEEVGDNPHSFLDLVEGISTDPQLLAYIALAAQQQIAEFFASDGTLVIDPDGPEPVFETPIIPPLPEDCGFVVEIPDFKACQ